MDIMDQKITASTNRMEQMESKITASTNSMEQMESKIAASTNRMEQMENKNTALSVELKDLNSRLIKNSRDFEKAELYEDKDFYGKEFKIDNKDGANCFNADYIYRQYSFHNANDFMNMASSVKLNGNCVRLVSMGMTTMGMYVMVNARFVTSAGQKTLKSVHLSMYTCQPQASDSDIPAALTS
ncbi:unnamed protein product [Allacma fusca]|uniref:Uncharacterized protein n=1 Tax=Allacma fusca TaxID=39272 RepID=A0A8J2L205_9HEXA|nr:unnamed protein product [Allacma fusca]